MTKKQKQYSKFKQDKDSFVILTVPHARCLRPPFPSACDDIALKQARILSRALTTRNIANVVLEGKINRTICDLNRSECAFVKFHDKLEALKQQHQDKRLLILDIHSGSPDPELRINKPIFLLDHPEPCDDQLIREFSKHTQSPIFRATHENFIIETATAQGIESALIEFNESNPPSPGKMNKLITTLVRHLQKR